MIEIKNVTKRFDNTISLNSITIDFNIGDSIALMGANGAGKTTLIRAILGYYHLDSGSILVNGLNPIKDRVEVLKHISFVPQLPPPIKLNISELLDFVSISSDISIDLIREYANEMKLDIDSNLKKSFFKLSGGMKQKLLIAISLAKQSDIIIYDEPTANLDPRAREDFYRLLEKSSNNKIMLFVTHRLEEVSSLVNREVYMDLGNVISDKKI